jgi:hypothetical protein
MKRNNLLIVWHGGLGDHIICNAIVRAKAAIYDLVCLPVKYHNCPSVIYMFRDLANVTIRPVYGDEDMVFFRDNVWKGEVLNLGLFSGMGFNGAEWDVEFYRHAGVEFGDRWNKWECQRDEQMEESVFRQAVSQYAISTRYRVFVHDDPMRGMKILFGPKWTEYGERITEMDSAVGCDILAPYNIQTPILFHWRKVIEACDDIHCIASSFAAFIDSIPLEKNPKLYLHAYCRPGEPLMRVNKQWEILT